MAAKGSNANSRRRDGGEDEEIVVAMVPSFCLPYRPLFLLATRLIVAVGPRMEMEKQQLLLVLLARTGLFFALVDARATKRRRSPERGFIYNQISVISLSRSLSRASVYRSYESQAEA